MPRADKESFQGFIGKSHEARLENSKGESLLHWEMCKVCTELFAVEFESSIKILKL
jgi:hypothetical protein